MYRIGLLVVILSFACVQEILNAEIADILDAPYMAAVLFRKWYTVGDFYIYGDTVETFRFGCNGAIISRSHVLTTATCVGDRNDIDIQVRVGSSFHHKGGRIRTIQGKRKHSNFSPDLDADIAVLTLSEPLKLSYRVAVVNLPEQDALIHNSKDAIITYFRENKFTDDGFANSLEQMTHFNVKTIFACNSYFRNKSPLKDLVTENMICTGLEWRNAPINRLAAPLVFNGTVYGIFSWERMNTDSQSVFTRVSAFSKWIKNW